MARGDNHILQSSRTDVMLIAISGVIESQDLFFLCHAGYSCENCSHFSLNCGKDNKGNKHK